MVTVLVTFLLNDCSAFVLSIIERIFWSMPRPAFQVDILYVKCLLVGWLVGLVGLQSSYP